MKNLFLILAVLATLLTACTSSAITPATASTNILSTQNQLILGTLKLEETPYAVGVEQAAELLPMWYVLKELNSSDTASQEEINGLVIQIEEAMTTEQIKTILALNLTLEDMVSAMQANGASTNSSQDSSVSAVSIGNTEGPPDMAAGGSPAGDPGSGMPGVALSGVSSSTNQDTTAQIPISSASTVLFDAVIEILNSKNK